MGARARIQVTGLRELQAALKQADAELPKALRLAMNAAVTLIADYARPKVPSRSGAARASIRPQSTQRAARLAIGGRRAPYMPWLDFGGKVGRHGSVVRDYRPSGRYLYPGLEATAPQVTEVMSRELDAIVVAAGLDVS